MNYTRVRKRVLWRDGNYRMIRYYAGRMYWKVQEHRDSGGWYLLHELTNRGFVNNAYLYANAKERRRITRENAQRGRDWLARHLRLKAAEPWELQCDSIDGEGTPCPIQRDGKCPVTKWFMDGCAGHGGGRPVPGVCDAPGGNRTFPSGRDEHDNTHLYYRNLLKEKEKYVGH
jgi:hypothetical protein